MMSQIRRPMAVLGMTALAFAAAAIAGTAQAADDAKVAPLKLTPAEIAERAARKGCKIKICSAFLLRRPGEDVMGRAV